MNNDAFKIDSPCDGNWDEMQGDESARHCTDCSRSVHHISTLTRAEAEVLVATTDAQGRTPCARYGIDSKGDIVFQPALIRPERRFGRFVALAALAAVGAGGAAVTVDGATEAAAPSPVSVRPGAGSVLSADPMAQLQAAVDNAVNNADPSQPVAAIPTLSAQRETEQRNQKAVKLALEQAVERAAEALRKASDALIRSKIRRAVQPIEPKYMLAGEIG